MSAAPGLLHQELSCPLCLQLFDAPVTAECGHSFCRACLSRAAGEPAADGSVPCPCCRAPTRPQALRTNLQLARLVEGLAQVPQGHCEEHLDPLSVYCEQDRALVCGVCASLGSHRGHRLLPAAEAHARLKVRESTRGPRRRGSPGGSGRSAGRGPAAPDVPARTWLPRSGAGGARGCAGRALGEAAGGSGRTSRSGGLAGTRPWRGAQGPPRPRFRGLSRGRRRTAERAEPGGDRASGRRVAALPRV